MGASGPRKLDRLIEAVARGERDLASIKDPGLREAVRIALRLHKDAPRDLDVLARLRMRDRVLGSFHPRRPTLADRVATLFEVIAKPAPYAVRAIGLVALCGAIVASATVAGADTLPEEPLYPVKIAGEDLRLALALSAEDRATVQFSIAEHRLAEAERLAQSGRVDDALIASSTYSQQIARAAAELAELEPTHVAVAALVTQLDGRFTAHRARMRELVTQLSADPATLPASEVLAVVAAPTLAPGLTGIGQIAETAAGMAEGLVKVAEARPTSAPLATEAPHVADVMRTDRAAETARAAATPRTSEHAAKVTDAARKAAEHARAAAEKAKAGKRGKVPARR